MLKLNQQIDRPDLFKVESMCYKKKLGLKGQVVLLKSFTHRHKSHPLQCFPSENFPSSDKTHLKAYYYDLNPIN